MCIIIDTHCAAAVFSIPPHEDFKPIHDWIEKRRGLLVLGGKNKEELWKIKNAKEAILGWFRFSGVSFESDELISEKVAELKQSGLVGSNDHHVLALALLSGVRWLCSPGDSDLCDDFKNRSILPPRGGRIYKNKSHAGRLDHTHSCPYSKSKRRSGRR